METPVSVAGKVEDRNQRRVRSPWTRGEKWILWTAMVTITAAMGAWAWVKSLDTMPVCKVPPVRTIYPNAYGYFVAASARAPIQFGTLMPKPNIKPMPDQHPETWLTRPSKPEALQAVTGAPAANAAGLAMLRRALTLPSLAPQDRSFKTGHLEFSRIRGLARAVAATTEVQASQGDDSGAVSTALDGIAMGVIMPRGGSTMAQLVGIAISAIDRRPIWRIAGRLNATTARSGARRLAGLETQREPITAILTNQKWATQASLMQLFEGPDWRKELISSILIDNGDSNSKAVLNATLQFAGKRQVLAAYTRQMNTTIAAANGPYRNVPYAKMGNERPVVQQFAGEAQTVWFKWCESALDNRLLAVTLALRAYRLDHGTYPANLQQLTPSYLPSLPEDPYSRAPLHYRRNRETYTLYSVGPDGVDDSGKPITTSEAGTVRYWVRQESHGDVVAGLNE